MELLNDMALFVEVMKARSFRRAAETLGMPNSTMSRRIGILEKTIGLRLLNRTTRKIEPTEAGQLYYERCKRIVDEARLAHEQLGEMLAQPSGTLRASLPVDFAASYLSPIIGEFARRYPGINFEFDLTPRNVDLVSEPFDVAVRVGEPPDSSLIARPLARLTSFAYAAPSYVEKFGDPQHPTELTSHECLPMSRINAWKLQKDGETVEVTIGGRFRLNSLGMIRRLATFGHGIFMAPAEVVVDEVAAGALQRVLPEWQGASVPIYALTETRLLPAKTQRFIEFLKENLSKARA